MRKALRHPATVTVAIVILLAAAFVAWRVLGTSGDHITAQFTRAVGVNVGSDVRVLGVRVGTITDVTPSGETVTVGMDIDPEYGIPADAKAVVIPPSIVADRYIQLTPAYTGGKKLKAGTNLGPDRTVVPLELDEVYASLDEFAAALGEDGSLGDAIDTAKENLEGNGGKFGDTLDDLADVSDTLNSHSDDIWSTVDNLADFTEALADSDAQVQAFNDNLADVSTQLADERDNLATAISELTVALADVSEFIDDNADSLTANVEQLAELSGVFARQQEALITILDYAPLALTNLDLAYNSGSGTLDTRDDVLGPHDPAGFLCAQLVHAVGIADVPKACFDLADALSAAGQEMPAELQDLVGQGSTYLEEQ
jgi:phospholipid/cholesterol/gamma-HCH transport system substrate-binding protein